MRDLSPIQLLRQSGITPDRSLGQNFLVDPNILDVIERMAGLDSEDVVLEVGPGLGVLTGRLLERCALVHCVEVDARLADHNQAAFGGAPGFRLHRLDALKIDPEELQPPPGKFVANLPYNIATPLVMMSLARLLSIGFWCLMVQKEIADRLFAATGSPNYGGPSVMTRLLAEKVEARQVSGSVFYPRPRVKSSLLSFRRRVKTGFSAGRFELVRTVVYGAFSHRRKTLVNSLAEADPGHLPAVLAPLPVTRRKEMITAALAAMGLAANIRAQELEPGQHEELAGAITGGVL